MPLQPVPLRRTPEDMSAARQALYDAIEREYECIHDEQEWRVYTQVNGAKQFRSQCLTCGRGRTVKRSEVPELLQAGLAEFDRDLLDTYSKRKWDDYRRRLADLEADGNSQWWADYSEYLDTPEWEEKRARVMQREQNLCQGCRLTRATHVHHLTYERVFNELLIDLVALCRDCHQRAHPQKDL